MSADLVSQLSQMDPTPGQAVRPTPADLGHQCGACHNVSDAQVRMGKSILK